jgi:predicted O-methyltransferase YrrM
LDFFNEKPLNILELGCSRDFNSRLGDGWSSFYFLDYINTFGGSFKTNDIVAQNIENCKDLLKTHPNFGNIQNRVEFIVDDALKVLDENSKTDWADLIYLDIGDSPELTLQCFEKINLNKTVVLCDDFTTKGTLLSRKYPQYLEMGWPSPIGHKMALYKKNQIKAYIFVNTVEN